MRSRNLGFTKFSKLSLLTGFVLALVFSCASKSVVDTGVFDQARANFDNGNYELASNQLKTQLDKARASKMFDLVLCEYILLLSKCYFHMNDYDKALPLAEESLALARMRWGESTRLVPYLQNNIRVLYKQKKFQESQNQALKLLALQEKTIGKDSSDIIDTLNLVIAAACAEDRCADTEPLLTRQLELRKKYLGSEHEHVAASLSQLAEIEEKKGRYDRAESLYKEALRIRQKSAPHLVESTQKNLVRIQLKRLSPSAK